MAGFKTHISFSGGLGAVYGAAAVQPLGFPTDTAILAAGLTTVGGMLPDLDSDSGVPVREMSGLAAAILPLLLIPRLRYAGLSQEGILAALLFAYIFIRYVAAAVFKRLTVHRGMFHSLPAMLIAGLVVYLEYHSPNRATRVLLAVGVMVGFFSHLLLDEIYSVNLQGVKVKLKPSAGTAVKLVSPSWPATAVCYGLLGALLYVAYLEYKQSGGGLPAGIGLHASEM